MTWRCNDTFPPFPVFRCPQEISKPLSILWSYIPIFSPVFHWVLSLSSGNLQTPVHPLKLHSHLFSCLQLGPFTVLRESPNPCPSFEVTFLSFLLSSPGSFHCPQEISKPLSILWSYISIFSPVFPWVLSLSSGNLQTLVHTLKLHSHLFSCLPLCPFTVLRKSPNPCLSFEVTFPSFLLSSTVSFHCPQEISKCLSILWSYIPIFSPVFHCVLSLSSGNLQTPVYPLKLHSHLFSCLPLGRFTVLRKSPNSCPSFEVTFPSFLLSSPGSFHCPQGISKPLSILWSYIPIFSPVFPWVLSLSSGNLQTPVHPLKLHSHLFSCLPLGPFTVLRKFPNPCPSFEVTFPSFLLSSPGSFHCPQEISKPLSILWSYIPIFSPVFPWVLSLSSGNFQTPVHPLKLHSNLFSCLPLGPFTVLRKSPNPCPSFEVTFPSFLLSSPGSFHCPQKISKPLSILWSNIPIFSPVFPWVLSLSSGNFQTPVHTLKLHSHLFSCLPLGPFTVLRKSPNPCPYFEVTFPSFLLSSTGSFHCPQGISKRLSILWSYIPIFSPVFHWVLSLPSGNLQTPVHPLKLHFHLFSCLPLGPFTVHRESPNACLSFEVTFQSFLLSSTGSFHCPQGISKPLSILWSYISIFSPVFPWVLSLPLGNLQVPVYPFVNCRQFMYLFIFLLVLRAGCGIYFISSWSLLIFLL